MKTFLIRLTRFAGAFAGFFIIVTCMVVAYVNMKASFKVPTDIKYVVFGHSHPEYAFNDSIIKGIKNYAKSSENLFYTHTKIEHVLKQNPSLDTIFVEFSNLSVSKIADQNIADDVHIQRGFSNLAPLENINDHLFLIRRNVRGYLAGVSFAYKTHFQKIIFNNFNYLELGGFLSMDRNWTDSLLANPSKTEQAKYPAKAYGTHTVASLKRIVDLCKSKDKTVILVRSPQHPKFEGRTNERSFQQLRAAQFADLEFLDFNDFPLDNSDYADLGHLNAKGARKFSVWFNRLLSHGLLNHNDKTKLISNELAKLRASEATPTFSKPVRY